MTEANDNVNASQGRQFGKIGLHGGNKDRARQMKPTAPNKKIEKRVAARLKDWEATTGKLKTKGIQKPGSQRKVRHD